jgi:2-polyprenyl-3-methyl-5-hydroxy-6-metoxy-1,4-benzoquinol methylase
MSGHARARARSSASFFDTRYAGHQDPWGFATDPYELDRYRMLMAYVEPAVHRRVFEPGCSIGVLTEMLARSGAIVHATDISEVAVGRARRRCSGFPEVTVDVAGLIPPPGQDYDLVVFSEIGYYQHRRALAVTLGELAGHVRPGGRLIAAHWIGTSPDHLLHGNDVHDVAREVLDSWTHRHHSRHVDTVRDGYLLDVWDRR